MNPTREEFLFAAALERPPADRAAFLDGACLGDDAGRKRVEGLIASHDATANLLHTAAGTAPTIKLDLADVPVPKVIDFGIAKATEGRLADNTVYTQLHQFIGTPAYMSPEQAEMSPAAAGDIDTRSDIYSLGVLLYELLAGSTPLEHLTHENNLHHHRSFHHPPRRRHPLCQRR